MDKMLPLFVCGIAYSIFTRCNHSSAGRLLLGEHAEVRCRPNSPCPTLLEVSRVSDRTRESSLPIEWFGRTLPVVFLSFVLRRAPRGVQPEP